MAYYSCIPTLQNSGGFGGGGVEFTPTTAAIRTAFANLGFTQVSTSTTLRGQTIYIYRKNTNIGTYQWAKAYFEANMYVYQINDWSSHAGYGNICIGTRLPTFDENSMAALNLGPDTQQGWTEVKANANTYYLGIGGSHVGDSETRHCIPVAYIV